MGWSELGMARAAGHSLDLITADGSEEFFETRIQGRGVDHGMEQ
jgi:hypothetical protein